MIQFNHTNKQKKKMKKKIAIQNGSIAERFGWAFLYKDKQASQAQMRKSNTKVAMHYFLQKVTK